MLGEKKENELPYVSKEFVERYQAYRSKQAPLSRYPQKLIGRTDADNGMNGYKAGAPLLIGNATEAKKVMLGGAGKSHLQIEKLNKQDLIACLG